MKFHFFIACMFVTLTLFQFCNKEDKYVSPEVEIFVPGEYASFNLPGKMLVEFGVKSANNIKFIRLSVDDADHNPLFYQKFFYPEEKEVQISYNYIMDVLFDQSNQPYYIHIVVDDGIKLSHTFRQIQLINAKKVFKGFYLFSNSSINQTSIKYVDTAYNEIDFATINGIYKDAETSAKDDMMFVTSSTPGKLHAFEFQDQILQWTQQPEAAYPDYTDLNHDGNYLFVGYGNERISILENTTGQMKVGTQILPDSVPLKIGVADNYFIGDFKSRTSASRSWVVFYRVSGSKFQSFDTDISVVDFYPSSFEGAMDVYGNFDGKGIMIRYYFEPNETGKKKAIPDGIITGSCRTDNWRYLISIGNKIYQSSIEGGYTTLFLDYPGSDIVDLAFDPINSLMFCLRAYQLEIYSYPDKQLIKTLESDESLKAIKLRYGY